MHKCSFIENASEWPQLTNKHLWLWEEDSHVFKVPHEQQWHLHAYDLNVRRANLGCLHIECDIIKIGFFLHSEEKLC